MLILKLFSRLCNQRRCVWVLCGRESLEDVLVAGEVAGNLQSTAEEPLNDVQNPQILRWEPVMSWHINQGYTLPYPSLPVTLKVWK